MVIGDSAFCTTMSSVLEIWNFFSLFRTAKYQLPLVLFRLLHSTVGQLAMRALSPFRRSVTIVFSVEVLFRFIHSFVWLTYGQGMFYFFLSLLALWELVGIQHCFFLITWLWEYPYRSFD